MEWYQLWVEIPGLGRQWAAWLWMEHFKALTLNVALQGCPGAPYTILDKNGQPLIMLPGMSLQ